MWLLLTHRVDCKLEEEEAWTDGDNEQPQLGHHAGREGSQSGFHKTKDSPREVGHPKDFGTNYTTDANGRDPHDSIDHFHNDFINDFEEVDDRVKNSSEGQTEEDDA